MKRVGRGLEADARQCEAGGESIRDGRVHEIGCVGEQRPGKHEVEGLHGGERVISGGDELHQRVVVEYADLHSTNESGDEVPRLGTHIVDQLGVARRIACVGTDINLFQSETFLFRFLGTHFFKRALVLLGDECSLCSHGKHRNYLDSLNPNPSRAGVLDDDGEENGLADK